MNHNYYNDKFSVPRVKVKLIPPIMAGRLPNCQAKPGVYCPNRWEHYSAVQIPVSSYTCTVFD